VRCGLPKACNSTVALSLERLDLPLRQLQRRLRARQRGLLLVELRAILLSVLYGASTGLLQVLVARRLLLGEHQGRLRLVHLRLFERDAEITIVEFR
jgi:hypothetical protein